MRNLLFDKCRIEARKYPFVWTTIQFKHILEIKPYKFSFTHEIIDQPLTLKEVTTVNRCPHCFNYYPFRTELVEGSDPVVYQNESHEQMIHRLRHPMCWGYDCRLWMGDILLIEGEVVDDSKRACEDTLQIIQVG